MNVENQDNQTTYSQSIVSGILEGLKNHKETSELSDVQIVIDNCEFKCHRVILAACSRFFKAVFTSGMKEDIERKVTLKEISRETFADVLDCMYTGKNIICERNMFEIWHAANQLQILFLLKECEMFLKQKINTENCLAVYQHSKLLDSTELILLSWDYIVHNFESVRRFEDILMLTDEEMGKLIANPGLQTNSEDGVMETILSWVTYKPTETSRCEFVYETQEIVQNCKSDTPIHLQKEDTLSEDCSQGCLEPDISSAADEQKNGYNQQRNGNNEQIKTFNRANHLLTLLKLTRVCLLSGKCLIETMSNDVVLADTRALEILQEGMEYILRTDRRHDFCPTSAVRRSNNHLENVIVAVTTYNSTHALVCRRQNGHWFGLGNISKIAYSSATITCFNHNVYVAGNNLLMNVYTPSTNQWRQVPQLTTGGTAKFVLSIGNFLYAVHQSECYSIEISNIMDAPFQGNWIKVHSLSSDLSCIKCLTVIGDKIIFFGTITGKLRIQIVIFDTATLHSFPLNDIPPLLSADICFSKGKDSFMLQKDGTLYRLKACSEAPFIEIKHETRLWDFNRDVKGAIVFDDELLLFGSSFSESDTDQQWELSIPGVFKCVKNITCSETYSCFMHTVIPKLYLSQLL